MKYFYQIGILLQIVTCITSIIIYFMFTHDVNNFIIAIYAAGMTLYLFDDYCEYKENKNKNSSKSKYERLKEEFNEYDNKFSRKQNLM